MEKTFTLLLFSLFFVAPTHSQTLTIPYLDDFESGAPGWYTTANGTGTTWELGLPLYGLTTGAYSGRNCWDTDLDEGYNNNSECFLYSPAFDFTSVPFVEISFYLNYYVERLFDYLAFQYSIDKGDSWLYLPFPNMINVDGNSTQWIRSAYCMSSLYGYSDVRFRFVFVSDESITYDGYSIDDFMISTSPLSINSNLTSSSINIYPNPVSDNIFINSPIDQPLPITFNLSSPTGQSVLTKQFDQPGMNSISLEGIPPGNYFVTLTTQNESLTSRILVTK